MSEKLGQVNDCCFTRTHIIKGERVDYKGEREKKKKEEKGRKCLIFLCGQSIE